MPLPTLVKTYEFQANQVVSGGASVLIANQNLVWAVSEGLRGNGTGWTDAANVALGGAPAGAWTLVSSNTWTSAAALTFAATGVAHSWAVFQNANGQQFCIDLNHATQYLATLVLFPTGIGTAGTGTARPSATDESVMQSQSNFGGQSSTLQTVLNVVLSTDDEIFFINMWRSNGSCCWGSVQAPPGNPIAGTWTGSEMAGFWNATTNSGTLQHSINVMLQNTQATARPTTTDGRHFFTIESGWELGGGASSQNVANDADGAFNFYPIGCQSITVGQRGRNFSLIDCWMTQDVNAQGSTFPDATPGPAKQFLKVGDGVMVWNQSTPTLS
jgi:hypothetical protein